MSTLRAGERNFLFYRRIRNRPLSEAAGETREVAISTGTKNLQEQIYFKDIPLLSNALGFEVDSLLMKGRKNYLCLHRYSQFFTNPSFIAPDIDRIRKKIEIF